MSTSTGAAAVKGTKTANQDQQLVTAVGAVGSADATAAPTGFFLTAPEAVPVAGKGPGPGPAAEVAAKGDASKLGPPRKQDKCLTKGEALNEEIKDLSLAVEASRACQEEAVQAAEKEELAAKARLDLAAKEVASASARMKLAKDSAEEIRRANRAALDQARTTLVSIDRQLAAVLVTFFSSQTRGGYDE